MKFRFCGDLDVPDWLLKEISTLSKLTALKLRALVGEIISKLISGDIDYEKIAKNTAAANFDSSDVKAVIASLNFILSGAAKYDVSSETLETELQQLGLPKENSEAISKVYIKSKDQLRAAFAGRVLKQNKLEGLDWRLDYILSSSSLHDLGAPSVQLNVHVRHADGEKKGQVEEIPFELNSDKFRVFLHELKQARALMENL
eukprot:TRINITY_DN12336_c0_g1_i1.p1 TRINITY_DN12336_c0_g1~~TRINITY_DN12336_c0_g1_i1.p1  ORF type:complete len:202 (+),score=47.35 TRINITY_DN12336_c0_g1_i1:23-628(+)